MWRWLRKRSDPPVIQAPMTEDEARRISEAEVEFREHEQPFPADEENMPVGIFFPLLRKRDGRGLKPMTVNGTYVSRVSDDVNALLAEADLRDKRSPRD